MANMLVGGSSSVSQGYYPASYGFDGNTATIIQWNATPWSAAYQLSSAKGMASYSIQLSNYGATYCPSQWNVYGTNNGTDWTLIDSRSGISWSTAYQIKSFDTQIRSAFGTFRWEFILPNGPICISEIKAEEQLAYTKVGPVSSDKVNKLGSVESTVIAKINSVAW